MTTDNQKKIANKRKDLQHKAIGHLTILVCCAALIWLIVGETYMERGYSAPVPEIRFDHDCKIPPNFLLRAIVESDSPKDLALFIKVQNFDTISDECSHIHIFLVPHGSKAVTTDVWASRLSKKLYFRTANGRGFALQFPMDGTGQHTPMIEFPDAVHRRSIEHSFFWLHFAPVFSRRDEISGKLVVEFSAAPFLIDDLKLRNGAMGSVFGDVAEIHLTEGHGFVIDLRDSHGEHGFALLNILIGVLAAIGTGSFTAFCRLFTRLMRDG